ncbi:unnamed protein product [Plutella xylostella]|uniref:(diamondback moth) hypothetical protein n=1 Tax=Plutella xylostella TaxID=51655 RepID=A0A8S4GC58_PLUXY|nr:unnamed protein product [Plutella xylostella]
MMDSELPPGSCNSTGHLSTIGYHTVPGRMHHSASTPAGVDGAGGGARTPPATPKKGGKMLALRVQMLDDTISMFQIQLVFKPDYWRTTAGERPGMFTTPPPLRKMVQTRSAHEREKMALLEQSTRDGPSGLDVNVATSEKITTKNELKACEPPVRKLIEKKLEADIAALEDCSKNSAASYSSVNVSQKVEQWLEHSHHDANDPPRPSTIPPPPGEPRHDAAALPSTVRDIAQSPPPPPPPPPAQPPSDMQQLVQAMKDIAVAAATSTPHSQMLSRLSTPRDLPTFAGDPLEWLNFVQAYEESTEVCHFTPKENMWRLRKCLRGPARDSVTALLVTAAAPETVMGALQLQYGNPDVILPRIIQDLNRLHAVSDDYQKDIISFSVKVQNYVAAVLALGRDEYLQETVKDIKLIFHIDVHNDEIKRINISADVTLHPKTQHWGVPPVCEHTQDGVGGAAEACHHRAHRFLMIA